MKLSEEKKDTIQNLREKRKEDDHCLQVYSKFSIYIYIYIIF